MQIMLDNRGNDHPPWAEVAVTCPETQQCQDWRTAQPQGDVENGIVTESSLHSWQPVLCWF